MLIDNERDRRRLALEVLASRTGMVTLAANATSTVLRDPRIASTSAVILVPATTSAAAEIGDGALHIPETSRRNGEITIAHGSNAQADRTFRYFIA